MKKSSNSTSIRVFCRLRPLNRLEKEQGGECCVQFTEKAIKVKVAGIETPYDFAFDGIFGSDTSQEEVFNRVARPVIDGLMEGYNGTIFAYGQTSSGKTYTMEGPDIIDSEEKLGIIPRMMNYLFNSIMNSSEDIEFNVKVSFLELYNEKLQDLIDPRKNNLQIKEDKSKGIFVQDITEVYVADPAQMKQIHKSGFENKTVAATRMNERSSRSHSIFILHVDQKDTKTDTTKHSKLYFVDLAGSEKIAKTNVTGQQLEEAKNINKSLTALGMVINALTEKDKAHVPYRDSKLTRLLQESLGGNSQTSLILACSMCTYNDKETVDTLRFGNRAKNIKNAPIVNAERSAKELTILLTAAERKIADQEEMIQSLQQQLGGGAPLTRRSEPESVVEAEQNAAESQPVEEKEVEQKEIKPEKKPASSSAAGGANSLMLLKHQIELSNLKEQLEELRTSNKELETELKAKNSEVYDLNGRILQYENQLNEFNAKNSAIEEYQMQFEKLYHETQEKMMITTKFKRAISRLKSDLNFVNISKHLKVLEGGDNSVLDTTSNTDSQGNKDDLVLGSIQKTVEILEEIEREIEESEKKATPNEEMENLIDTLMNNNGSPILGNDILANPEDEIKGINWMTESSSENKDSIDFENSKIDGDNDDDPLQRSQLQFQSFMDEGRVAELQGLVSSQRKTINNLTKLNNELTQSNQKFQASQEKNLQIYKTKLEEFQKTNLEKIKEYDGKIHTLKSHLETKINEIEGQKSNYEKYLLEKAQSINDLRQQNQKLQSLIAGDGTAVKSYELDNTLREVTYERKKLAEEIARMRKEADDQDEVIKHKTTQIEMLQGNLGLAAKEIKTLKQARPANMEIPTLKGGKESKGGQRKNEFGLFDKHVVKPIRGGGGDAFNFAKNNLFPVDKPTRSDTPVEERKTKTEEKSNKTNFFSSIMDDLKPSKSSKDGQKADLSKQKRGSVSQAKSPGEEGEDDETNQKTQQKLKDFASKSLVSGQKNLKAFVGNMKNLFS